MLTEKNKNYLIIRHVLYYSVGTLILLAPALYDHFPLIYADLGTYIRSGFMTETPVDRPITYGILLRLFSFNGCFLFGMVILQAVTLLWVMRLFVRSFFAFLSTK